MLTIAKLFGKSPFSPLQSHMDKVGACIKKLSEIFGALHKDDPEKIEELVAALSKLEHEADLTKNDIRNHLPKGLFLPIDRGHLLDILSSQDCIADKAEEIGILLTLRPLDNLSDFKAELQALFEKNIEVFWSARKVIQELDELLESSFGGIEAEKVKTMVEKTAYKDHEAKIAKRILLKKLFSQGDLLPVPSFYLWLQLIEEISLLSHLSENLANRIRMVLELK
jgi:predicted phosphate transport protein (TIGR00153 family)